MQFPQQARTKSYPSLTDTLDDLLIIPILTPLSTSRNYLRLTLKPEEQKTEKMPYPSVPPSKPFPSNISKYCIKL